MNKHLRKIFLDLYKDIEFPKLGDLIYGRQGKHLGQVGMYLGEHVGKHQIEWQNARLKTSAVMPYDEDDLRIKLGKKVWTILAEAHNAGKTSK